MPGGDRTGPQGMGPMSGRGAGVCAGFDVPGYANLIPGRGFGLGRGGGFGRGFGRSFGRGGGRGWRHMDYASGLPGLARAGYYPSTEGYPAEATANQELEYLKSQAQHFQKTLGDINDRIKELEKSKPDEQ